MLIHQKGVACLHEKRNGSAPDPGKGSVGGRDGAALVLLDRSADGGELFLDGDGVEGEPEVFPVDGRGDERPGLAVGDSLKKIVAVRFQGDRVIDGVRIIDQGLDVTGGNRHVLPLHVNTRAVDTLERSIMALFTDSKLAARVAALETSLASLSEGQEKILSLLTATVKAGASKENGKSSPKSPMKGKKTPEQEEEDSKMGKTPEQEDEDQAENDADPVAGGVGSEPDKAGEPESDPVDSVEGGAGDEEPEPGDQSEAEEEGNPDYNKGETREDQDAADEEGESDTDKEKDEEQGEDEEDEPTAPTPKPKTGKKASASTKHSLSAEVASLKAQLAELQQNGLVQAAANIGIKPIARVDKAETTADIADPVARTYANWSKPLKVKAE
jgi:hypothetical protein